MEVEIGTTWQMKSAKNSPPTEGWQSKTDGVVPRSTKNYKSLPYNPRLKGFAKSLRKAGNLAEVLFWNQVKRKNFKKLDFDRQKIIGDYVVDFYCTSANAVIEIDGDSHNDKVVYDAKRDRYLISLGLEVVHIPDIDVKQNLPDVMDWLAVHPVFSGF